MIVGALYERPWAVTDRLYERTEENEWLEHRPLLKKQRKRNSRCAIAAAASAVGDREGS